MSRDDEFVRETRTSVRQLTNGLVELERHGSSRDHVDELFRTAHTLKGNCSMAGLDGASRLAHTVEDFLSSLRDESLTPNPDLIDAALASVDDIDAILQEWHHDGDVTTDPEPSMSTLRAEMERYRDASQAGAGMASDSSESAASASEMPDEPTDEFDQSVVDALESASGFDDLEGLLAEMDDPTDEADDEQSRWGTFDKRESSPAPSDSPVADRQNTSEDATEESSDDSHPTAEQSEGDEDTPLGKIESPSSSGAMDEFDAIKSGVQQDDVSSLDHELDDIEFGEFDHDDDLSIQDLIDGKVADADTQDEDVVEADTDDQPVSSPDTADTKRADDTIRPEDFGYDPAGTPTPDEPATADESEGSDAGSVTASGADDSNPFEGIEIVDPDDETDADDVAADIDTEADDESVAPDEPTVSTPDEPDSVTDEPEPVTEEPEPESVTASSSPVDVDVQASDPDELGEEPDDEPTTETPTFDSEPETTVAETPDFADTFEDDDGGTVGGFGDGDDFSETFEESDFPEEFDEDIDFSTDDAEDDLSDDVVGDDIDLSDDEFSDDFSEVETDSVEETPDALSEAFDDDLSLPQEFLSGSLDDEESGSADGPTPAGDDIDIVSEGDTDDVGLPDVDLPDVDELTGISLSDDDTDDVSFERDEHTMAFESRFAERFGGSAGDDKVQLVQMASSTIEASSLDAARYQSSGTTESPVDFGETRESDRIQSLTVDVENADSLLNLVEELSLTQLRIKQSDGEDLDDHLSVMDSVTGDLRRAVMSLRLMPLSTAIDGLPRVVRDIARKQDKEVAFEVSDEGVNLDRSIVEKLGDPLVHLVRNAVDHGIESPDERQKQGKPLEGTIELRAWRDRERVVIEVEDDGRGISAERVRQQAIDHDIISRERAEQMSFDEVYDLVFEAGFSTAEEVTDVSGRGVGMDAVRRTVNSLDGTVDLDSEPGSGTTVRLRLPVSVAVSKMLFVGVGHEQYAIPASIVADVELVDESDLNADGTVAIERTDEMVDAAERIPYRRLSDALGVETSGETVGAGETADTPTTEGGWDLDGETDNERESGDVPAGKQVIVRLDPETRNFALVCDEVDDAREVVVKPYEKLLGGVPGISGATMSGDGTLVNIIDVTTL